MGILCLACLWAGWQVMGRPYPARNVREEDLPDAILPLSVIIPARNEENNLSALLDALSGARPPPAEILVVDDGSTDETAAIARQRGIRVVPPGDVPPGWRGKTWACWKGAQAAAQPWLCFMDADTRPSPPGLAVAWHLAGRLNAAVSVAAYQRVGRVHENLSAFFVLAMSGGVGGFSRIRRRVKQGLFGPFLLVSRQHYERVGGHKAVKAEILEHFFMARRFLETGVRTEILPGRGILDIRMYPGRLQNLISGWRKAFSAGAQGSDPRLLFLTVLWMSGGVMAVFLCFGATGLVHPAVAYGGYPLFAVSYGLALRRVGKFAVWCWLVYPIPLFFFLLVYSGVIGRRQPATWKGRSVEE